MSSCWRLLDSGLDGIADLEAGATGSFFVFLLYGWLLLLNCCCLMSSRNRHGTNWTATLLRPAFYILRGRHGWSYLVTRGTTSLIIHHSLPSITTKDQVNVALFRYLSGFPNAGKRLCSGEKTVYHRRHQFHALKVGSPYERRRGEISTIESSWNYRYSTSCLCYTTLVLSNCMTPFTVTSRPLCCLQGVAGCFFRADCAPVILLGLA